MADGDIEFESPLESLRPGQSDWITRLLQTVTDWLILRVRFVGVLLSRLTAHESGEQVQGFK